MTVTKDSWHVERSAKRPNLYFAQLALKNGEYIEIGCLRIHRHWVVNHIEVVGGETDGILRPGGATTTREVKEPTLLAALNEAWDEYESRDKKAHEDHPNFTQLITAAGQLAETARELAEVTTDMAKRRSGQ